MAFKEFQRSRYQAIEGEHDHRGSSRNCVQIARAKKQGIHLNRDRRKDKRQETSIGDRCDTHPQVQQPTPISQTQQTPKH